MKIKQKDMKEIPENKDAGLNLYQAARLLGVSVHMVKKLMKEGKLPYYRIGRRIASVMRDVLSFRESCRRQGE